MRKKEITHTPIWYLGIAMIDCCIMNVLLSFQTYIFKYNILLLKL